MSANRPSFARFGALLIAALPNVALAQLAPGVTRDLSAPQERFDVKPPPGIDLQAPVPPVPVVPADGTVTISGFRFEGNTRAPSSVLEAVTAPWVGRALSASDLRDVIDAVTTYLRQRGLYAAYARF